MRNVFILTIGIVVAMMICSTRFHVLSTKLGAGFEGNRKVQCHAVDDTLAANFHDVYYKTNDITVCRLRALTFYPVIINKFPCLTKRKQHKVRLRKLSGRITYQLQPK